MNTDHERAILTSEGEQIMTRFLCSKKAASLVDSFKVATMGEFSCLGWKDSSDPLYFRVGVEVGT